MDSLDERDIVTAAIDGKPKEVTVTFKCHKRGTNSITYAEDTIGDSSEPRLMQAVLTEVSSELTDEPELEIIGVWDGETQLVIDTAARKAITAKLIEGFEATDSDYYAQINEANSEEVEVYV